MVQNRNPIGTTVPQAILTIQWYNTIQLINKLISLYIFEFWSVVHVKSVTLISYIFNWFTTKNGIVWRNVWKIISIIIIVRYFVLIKFSDGLWHREPYIEMFLGFHLVFQQTKKVFTLQTVHRPVVIDNPLLIYSFQISRKIHKIKCNAQNNNAILK